MFKFGFDGSQPTKPPSASAPQRNLDQPPKKVPFSSSISLKERQHDAVPLCDSDLLLRKSTATAPSHLSPNGADIVPTTYEGGFKLWECAIDLTEYLHSTQSGSLRGKSVLELGAGHAFPAIVAAKHGATPVHVQDYNVEVLTDVTMPNIVANVLGHTTFVEFFAGAWQGLPAVLDRTYDVVLSTDTVYAKEQIDALAECVLDVLAPGGVAFIAGKTYYFGVGGGTQAFDSRLNELARERGEAVDTRIVKEIRDGYSNIREIVKITRH